jgi:flagellar hook-associated protein 2
MVSSVTGGPGSGINGAAIVNNLTGGTMDVQSLAQSLTDAERAPQQALLDNKLTAANARISSIGKITSSANTLKSGLAAFGDPKGLPFQPASTNPNIASFTFKPYYPPSKIDMSFEVKSLCSGNQVTLGPIGANDKPGGTSAITPTLALYDKDGNTVQTLDMSGKTLEEVRDSINKISGFGATILNNGTQRYLSISKGTGADNNFSVGIYDDVDKTKAPLAGGLQADNANRPKSTGQDAEIVSGNVHYFSATNQFSKLISNITINVTDVTPAGQTVQIVTSSDPSTSVSALRSLVDNYNKLITTIHSEIKYDPDITKRGGLANDFVSKSLLNQLRQLTTSSISVPGGGTVSLAQIGVKTKMDGTLEINETLLSKTIVQNPDMINYAMGSTDSVKGIIEKMSDLSDVILGENGQNSALIKERDQAQNKDIPKINDQLTSLATRMDAVQQRYLKQFTVMQSILNDAKSTQSNLTSSMAAWTAGLKNG